MFDDSNVAELSPRDTAKLLNKPFDDGIEIIEDTSVKETSADSTSIFIEISGKPGVSRASLVNPKSEAYMLLYRRRDPRANLNFLDDEKIPMSLKERIGEEDEIYLVQKAEYERIRNLLTINVRFNDSIFQVQVQKNQSMKQAIAHVHRDMKLEESGIRVPNVRLREILTLKNIPGKLYIPNDALVASYKFPEGKLFMIETSTLGMDDSEDVCLEIKVLVWQKGLIAESFNFRISENATIGNLREKLASRCGKISKEIMLLRVFEDTAMAYSNDSESLTTDLQWQHGSEVILELCSDFLTSHSEFLADFAERTNQITYIFLRDPVLIGIGSSIM